MARIPRSFARRARSTASIFLGTPSGSECVCISIAPLRVCAFADNEKTRNIAASCDLMDIPFHGASSLELGVDLDPTRPWAPSLMGELCYCITRCRATSECEATVGQVVAAALTTPRSHGWPLRVMDQNANVSRFGPLTPR